MEENAKKTLHAALDHLIEMVDWAISSEEMHVLDYLCLELVYVPRDEPHKIEVSTEIEKGFWGGDDQTWTPEVWNAFKKFTPIEIDLMDYAYLDITRLPNYQKPEQD